MIEVRALMRTDLKHLHAYSSQPDLTEIERRLGRAMVRLDANENPYGPSPRVTEALATCRPDRYPDPGCTDLRRHLSTYVEMDPAGIVCGAGGDEIIDLIFRLFLEPGDEVIDLTPSFAMYGIFVSYHGGRVIRVPRDAQFAVDVEAVERALTPRTKVICLCSPNNPTGNVTPRDDVVRLLDTGRVVLLDEAYIEFAGGPCAGLIEQYPNVIVLRSMSKWAGLAGLRLGYGLMQPALAADMAHVRSPYTVSAAAQAAGIASLQDTAYLMGNVTRILQERERLRRKLAALNTGTVLPSQTNFLCWLPGELDPLEIRASLIERGVVVRAFTDPLRALRISVGRPEESDLLLDALEDVCAKPGR